MQARRLFLSGLETENPFLSWTGLWHAQGSLKIPAQLCEHFAPCIYGKSLPKVHSRAWEKEEKNLLCAAQAEVSTSLLTSIRRPQAKECIGSLPICGFACFVVPRAVSLVCSLQSEEPSSPALLCLNVGTFCVHCALGSSLPGSCWWAQ